MSIVYCDVMLIRGKKNNNIHLSCVALHLRKCELSYSVLYMHVRNTHVEFDEFHPILYLWFCIAFFIQLCLLGTRLCSNEIHERFRWRHFFSKFASIGLSCILKIKSIKSKTSVAMPRQLNVFFIAVTCCSNWVNSPNFVELLYIAIFYSIMPMRHYLHQ